MKSAEKQGKGVIVFSPLAQGILTDKYLKGIPKDSRISKSGIYLKESNITPALLGKVEKLNSIAKQRGETLAQMALSWALCNEQVTSVLIGASRPEQITENVKILKSKKFSGEELRLIDEISKEELD